MEKRLPIIDVLNATRFFSGPSEERKSNASGSGFRKAFFFVSSLLFALLLTQASWAQVVTPQYSKGGGTGSNAFPFNTNSVKRSQHLYLPGDLPGALPGNIIRIYVRAASAGSAGTYTDFRIRLGQTAATTFPGTSSDEFFTNLTTVLTAASFSLPAQTVDAWVPIDLQIPFLYNPAQTLVVEFEMATGTGGFTVRTSTGPAAPNHKRITATTLTATTGSSSNIWTDFGIDVAPSTPCSGAPVAGNATSSVSSVCPNTTFQLSLTGNTFASGITYQWQSSANGTTGWADITGATNPNYQTTQTTTTHYRARLTCGTQSSNSGSVMVITTATPVSGTFTINKANPTAGTNFASFADAINSFKCGGLSGPIVFNVVAGSGPYTEQVLIPVIPGVSATNTITFNGNANILVSSAASGDAFKLDGADYVRVNNLTIRTEPTATAGAVVALTNGAENNIFTGNTFTHTGSLGATTTSYGVHITTGNNSNNTFSNNTINGGYYGIYNYGASATLHSNNQFTGNMVRDSYFYGIYHGYGTGTLIEGNDISRPTRTNAGTLYGIYLTTGSTGVTVSKNRIHNTHDAATSTTGTVYGIYVGSAGTVGSETMVKNNAIYNINANGGTLYALYNTGGNNTYYYHNTVSADMPGVSYSLLRGMYFLSASTNVKFQNNNISLGSTATTKHAIYLGSATISLTSNGNNLYAPNGNVGYVTSARATLADWRTGSSQDANSVSADPQFVNLATGDLKPTNSTLNNVGVALTPAVTDDITGAPRSTTTPDPGAYEFVPAANDAGITAIVSPTSPANPNTSLPVTVTIKNYGLNALTAATITWTVNGTAQTSFNWTGNLANNQTANVTIGNYSFPAGSHVLNICTSMPNGATDGNPGNDCQTMTVISCAALNGTYTINKNAGATATNFISFASAVNTLNSCGISGPVTINVVTGTGSYLENVEINAIPGTSATNTITFNGNGNTLQGTSSAGVPTLKLDGADFIRVNNLVIETLTTATAGPVIHLTNGADNNTFNGNSIRHTGSLGSTTTSYAVYIQTGSNNNNAFQNNTIIGGYYGIYNYGSSTLMHANNQFTGNTLRDQYFYGIYNGYSTGTLIEGNDISRPTRTNSGSLYGIYLTTSSTGVTISKNRIHNTHDVATSMTGTVYGIYVGSAGTAGTETIIKNNAIYNINNNGGAFYGFYNSGGNNTYYYHNTISADMPNVNYTTLRGMYFLSASTNVRFINNNISLSSNGSTSKHAIYLGSTTISLQSNNNNLYVGATGNIGYSGGDKATLALWQAANTTNPYDMASVSVDPLYVNLATGDLKPTNVAMNGAGQPLAAVTDDILGSPRNATIPDPGAFEFNVSPNDVGVIAVTGPASGCGLTNAEAITITIKNFGSATQSNIPVNFTVGGNIIGTGTIAGPLLPNATATLTFTQTANLATAGSYVIVVNTLMPGDSDASNNSMTLNVTNSLMAGLPALNFETPATGIGAVRIVTNGKSDIEENAAASLGTGSTKGMLMKATTASGWIMPVGITDPWTNNPDFFSAAYMCFNPAGGNPNDPLWLSFDLKQTFNTANANTNFRVTINGTPIGGNQTSPANTYRPPFNGVGGTTDWTKIYLDLTSYKNLSNIQIGFESSVGAPFAAGSGPANMIDNVRVVRVNPTGVKDNVLASSLSVYPNPSAGMFTVSLPKGKAFEMEVTDLTGKVIMKQTVKGNAAQLDLKGQAQGVYMLKIASEGNTAVQKLIIQ